MTLTVIIPTLNEASGIGSLVASLAAQENIDLEVIVVDGGSTDETRKIAESNGAHVIVSDPGRGCQMNAGAAVAQGEYLLFLHADSTLTHSHQLHMALDYLAEQPVPSAGHFSLVFRSENPDTRTAMAFFEYKTCLNRPGTFNGDQGLLIRASDFRLLQGFSTELSFLEDQEFGERFNAYGRFVTLPGQLITSARRFDEEGVSERIMLNTLIMGMYHLGIQSFFEKAADAYRSSDRSSRLDLLPFVVLVEQSVFDRGPWTAAGRIYRIGRFATRNLWQVFLWWGLRKDNVDNQLSRHDRFVKPIVNNPLGYFIAALGVTTWFYTCRYRLRR